MLDIIIYFALAIVLAVSIGYIVVLRSRINRLIESAAQMMIDKGNLLKKLSEALTALEQKPIEQTDGFLRYLETTRDSAFTFIEDVQVAISKFDSETKTIFAKSDLNKEDANIIKQAYDNLKAATLPDDVPNN